MVLNVAALISCYLTSSWGIGVPNSCIGFIVEAFPEGAGKAIWIAGSITISNCVLQSFIGDMSDILGRRGFLLVGQLLAIVGMIISGRANSMNMVIGGQVLNGIGLTLGYLAIPFLTELVPKNARAGINSVASVATIFPLAFGPIIQGAFINNHLGGEGQGWRAGFYMGACLYAISFVLILAFYHPLPRPNPEGLSTTQRLLRIDWVGIFLAGAALTIFLVGLHFGDNPYRWSSAMVVASLVVGIVCGLVFGLWEWKGVKHGILDHGLFSDPNFAWCLILSAIGGINLYSGLAYLPQEILSLFAPGPVLTGVYNLPFNLITPGGAILAAVIIRLTGEAKWVIVGSYFVLLVSSGLMAVMQPHINFAAWFFPTALLGIASGVQTSILVVIASVCTPNHLIAAAISLVSSLRALGGSVGIVIFGQIFQSKLPGKLIAGVSNAVVEAGLSPSQVPSFLHAFESQNPTLIMGVQGVNPAILEAAQTASSQAHADSYRFIWYSLIPFAALALMISLLLRPVRDQLTRQVVAGVRD
jgi:MFS family permease